MENTKILMNIKELEKKDGKKNYEVLIENENWSRVFNESYEALVRNNTSHLQLKGFRENANIPLVLFEIKYKDYFDKLKNDSFQYTLAMINMQFMEEIQAKYRLMNFRLDENTNNLYVYFEENILNDGEKKEETNTETNDRVVVEENN
jgi:hypothetical protein